MMGFGWDYDEDFMQMIVEYGGGSYYFIENFKQMICIFEFEFDMFFMIIGKDVEIEFVRSDVIDNVEILSFGVNCKFGLL